MKKGFTLVELLSVIIILGFLSVIIIPPVLKTIDEAREKSYNQLITNLTESAQLYVRQHKDELDGIDVIGNSLEITLKDLTDSGAIKAPVTDPKVDKEVSLDTPIYIYVEKNNKYNISVGTFTYVD